LTGLDQAIFSLLIDCVGGKGRQGQHAGFTSEREVIAISAHSTSMSSRALISCCTLLSIGSSARSLLPSATTAWSFTGSPSPRPPPYLLPRSLPLSPPPMRPPQPREALRRPLCPMPCALLWPREAVQRRLLLGPWNPCCGRALRDLVTEPECAPWPCRPTIV